MYATLLFLHSWIRWVALLFLVLRLATAAQAWVSRRGAAPVDKFAGIGTIASLHTQLLLGIILFFTSPTVSVATQDMGAAMKQTALRFWTVEHTTLMVLAVVVVHVSHVLGRKASDVRAGFFRVAVGHGLGLLMILAAIPWPWRAEVGRALLSFP